MLDIISLSFVEIDGIEILRAALLFVFKMVYKKY
jgi:hypothetical protein